LLVSKLASEVLGAAVARDAFSLPALSQALNLVYHQSNEGRPYQCHTQLTITSSKAKLVVRDNGEGLVAGTFAIA